jgi:hypothetical protein
MTSDASFFDHRQFDERKNALFGVRHRHDGLYSRYQPFHLCEFEFMRFDCLRSLMERDDGKAALDWLHASLCGENCVACSPAKIDMDRDIVGALSEDENETDKNKKSFDGLVCFTVSKVESSVCVDSDSDSTPCREQI